MSPIENNINNNNFFTDLKSRNLVFQSTSNLLEEKLNNNSLTFYAGFDMTAESLHIGSFLLIKTIIRFIANGHNAIILFGGFTSKIGDPHGKSQERKILSQEIINHNKKLISEQVKNIIERATKSIPENKKGKIIFLDNEEWLSKISYDEFLNEYARFLSVNSMIKLETAANRLENQIHLSLLEFNYMVLQGIDFEYLNRNYNCTLQLSGSDQWGNMLIGVELIQKKYRENVFGMTIPLLVNSNGKKMGKTEEGAIWLSKKLCSPYTLWQYLRNIDDETMEKMFYQLSDHTIKTIQELFKSYDINKLKVLFANEMVLCIHGYEELKIIYREISKQFGNNQLFTLKEFLEKTPNLPIIENTLLTEELSEENNIITLESIMDSPSSFGFSSSIINNLFLSDLLVLTSLLSSKSEAKRKITEGAIKINGNLCKDLEKKITIDMFLHGVLCLEFGKKNRRYIFLQEINEK